MRKYKYLVLKNKTSLTKYFVRHCVILDEATSLCYHLDDEGYKIEPLSNLMERYDLVEEYAFQSVEDVETFMICYAKIPKSAAPQKSSGSDDKRKKAKALLLKMKMAKSKGL